MQDQLRYLHEPLSEKIAFLVPIGINLVHVPYRGGYVPDLLSGQVQVVFGTRLAKVLACPKAAVWGG
jgi:hypothetical protein